MLRQQFPILSKQINDQPLVYLDNAATSQKPKAVLDAVQNYYQQQNANVHRGSHHLGNLASSAFEQARQAVAQFINAATTEEVIWTSGATASINLVANTWGLANLKAQDEILISSLEHHANILPWQQLAQHTGALLKVIPLNAEGELDQQAFTQLLSSKTKLLALTHASNVLGGINPIKSMTAAAQSLGAKVLIDGAQAAAHLDIDVVDIGCDFYLFSGHKVFAPTGIGVLWGRKELLEQMPPWQLGGEMVKSVSFETAQYNDLPFKFEAGTANIAGAIGLGAALNWLSKQDRTLLASHEQNLLAKALDYCSDIPCFQAIGNPEQRLSIMPFQLNNQHHQDISLLLDQDGIAIRSGHHCAMPLMNLLGMPGCARASFAFYNSLEEVERFAHSLAKIAAADQVQVSFNNKSDTDFQSLFRALKQSKDWNSRYRQLMLLGKAHEGLAAEQKADKHLVQGCESKTWLLAKQDSKGSFYFKADSEARIMRGLIQLVLAKVNHQNSTDILMIDWQQEFKILQLEQHLSPSRNNGLAAIINQIKQLVDR